MTTTLAPAVRLQTLVDLTVARLNSPHSRRVYARALREFLAYWQATGKPFCRAVVQQYRTMLIDAKKRPATVNLSLSAVKTLAQEAVDYGWMENTEAQAILSIKGVPRRGVRLGNWLTVEQAQKLLSLPDLATPRGQRDFLLLALLLGCGMRRAEVCSLRTSHVTIRGGRLILKDVIGKGKRMRPVPVPPWAWEPLQAWCDSLGEGERWLLPRFHQARISNTPLSENGVNYIVKHYGNLMGMPELAAHDLRRSFGKLARKNGAPIDQIQFTLGHASINTTELYLGGELDLEHPACDYLGVKS